jgi:hypothetical protein
MTVQRVAQVFGWIFVLVAVWGFFVSGGSMEEGGDAPAILGLFPVNVLHNLAHLLLGVWGILAARSFGAARSYARIAGILYVLLAVLGYIDPSGFGLIPLGHGDIGLHAVLGVVLAGIGFTAKAGPGAR